MTSRPTRATEAGRTYLDLQNLARSSGRATDELQQLYVLECFLDRLARSPYANQFVLKGGVLLAAYGMRRPTRDVDLRADRLPATPDAVLETIRNITTVPVDDGLIFDAAETRAELIRDEDVYNGVRVIMTVQLASARVVFHVDVNVGDPVIPQPRAVELPRLRGGVVTLLGYPLVMVHAEKIVTMLERGEVNTRWRDFGDVFLLAGRHGVVGDELTTAMRTVAEHRGATLQPLAPLVPSYGDSAQRKWSAWIRKQRLDDRLPPTFTQALIGVAAFADPALAGEVSDHTWAPLARTWQGPGGPRGA